YYLHRSPQSAFRMLSAGATNAPQAASPATAAPPAPAPGAPASGATTAPASAPSAPSTTAQASTNPFAGNILDPLGNHTDLANAKRLAGLTNGDVIYV